jgi:hypothetical protein
MNPLKFLGDLRFLRPFKSLFVPKVPEKDITLSVLSEKYSIPEASKILVCFRQNRVTASCRIKGHGSGTSGESFTDAMIKLSAAVKESQAREIPRQNNKNKTSPWTINKEQQV